LADRPAKVSYVNLFWTKQRDESHGIDNRLSKESYILRDRDGCGDYIYYMLQVKTWRLLTHLLPL
jgi:hypothetical protein